MIEIYIDGQVADEYDTLMFDKLIDWSRSEYYQLPWRRNRSLYTTLVSEVMLQQTTVATVQKHYQRFLQEFPTLEKIAMASEADMLVAWKGLGYYRRAKNLRLTCIDVMEKFAGKIPSSRDDLLLLRGIGPYTAGALLAIGLNKNELAIDANLERVLARIYGIQEKSGPKLHKQLRELFLGNSILQDAKKIGPRLIHEALMDLGRVYCQANKVNCVLCPMNRSCLAFKSRSPLNYPIKTSVIAKSSKLISAHLIRLIVRRSGNILVYQKQENEWLHGQWELPTFAIAPSIIPEHQYPEIEKKLISTKQLKLFKSSITKYQFQNYVCELDLVVLKKLGLASKRFIWKNENEVRRHLSTAGIKALES